MLPDWSMRKMMSRGARSADSLTAVQLLSSTLPSPASMWMIPPEPTVPPPAPPLPEDALWLWSWLVVGGTASALQPHHAAARQASVIDTKTGRLMECSSVDEDVVDV